MEGAVMNDRNQALLSQLARHSEIANRRAFGNALILFDISRTIEISKIAVTTSRELLVYADAVLSRDRHEKNSN